jgi:DnaJ-class molecular chaperone
MDTEESTSSSTRLLVECRVCHGNGYKIIKTKLNRKSILETVQCKACLGTKLVTKLPKQKKKVTKSYPSFVAPGNILPD